MMKRFLKNMKVAFLLLIFVLCVSPAQSAESITTFFHNDPLGSPIAASNIDGEMIWKENYQPFGERKVKDAKAGLNSVWYTGKPQDESTGLSYYGARYYDPAIGRFMSIDPVGFHEGNIQSFNRYAYGNNNPYRFIDPDGRVPLDTIWDAIHVVYDVSKIGLGYVLDNPRLVQEGGVDLAVDTAALFTPYLPAGSSKLGRLVAKSGGKPDFIVSPKGMTMPTNKDFNLVDSNKKGGDWFQIHNKHTDAKVGGSPHTHFPKQHGGSRTREIKRTDGGDLDYADNALRNGTMRERRNRGDKGG